MSVKVITYLAVNTSNGKFYIGSTNDMSRRKREHLSCKFNYPFNNAYRRSPEKFEWQTVEDDSEEPVLEQALLDMWFGTEQCYNLSPFANRPPDNSGTIWWTEVKSGEEMKSDTCPGDGWQRGRNREKLEAMWENNRGKRISDETRQKISKKNKGKRREEKVRNKMRESWKGKKWWVNFEGETCRSVDCPGEGWLPGRFTAPQDHL
jgi:predicted GIY-YIG superfamily endonuclease